MLRRGSDAGRKEAVMISAGKGEVGRVVAEALCGGAYADEIAGSAQRAIAGCEQGAVHHAAKAVASAKLEDGEQGIFDKSLESAAASAARICKSETGYAGSASSPKERSKFIACTQRYVTGGRLFAFEAKRGLTYEKLLAYLVERAQGRVAIASEDVDIPLPLRKSIEAARKHVGEFFSDQAEGLFRSALVHLGGKERAVFAGEVAARVGDRLRAGFGAYFKEKKPKRRAALAEELSRAFVAHVDTGGCPPNPITGKPTCDENDNGVKLTFAQMPASLFNPRRLGVKGAITPALQKELRRLFTSAFAQCCGAKRLKGLEAPVAQALIDAVRLKNEKDPAKLATALRGAKVASAVATAQMAGSYDKSGGRIDAKITLGKRCAGEIDEISGEMDNPYELAKADRPCDAPGAEQGGGEPASQPVTICDPTTGKCGPKVAAEEGSSGCTHDPKTGEQICDDDEGGGVLNPFGGNEPPSTQPGGRRTMEESGGGDEAPAAKGVPLQDPT
jgi:hypothetical protein